MSSIPSAFSLWILAVASHETARQCHLRYGNMTFVLDPHLVSVVVPTRSSAGIIDHDKGEVRYLDACRKTGNFVKGLCRLTLKPGAGTSRRAAFDRPYLSKPILPTGPLGAGLLALKTGERVSVTVISTRHHLPPRRRGLGTTMSRA